MDTFKCCKHELISVLHPPTKGEQTYFEGGSTLALIFRKSWFITARFHSIHLCAYFPQVNVTIALIVFYWQLSYQFKDKRGIY